MTGKAGGGFVFDTNSLHRGLAEGNFSRTVVILEFHAHGKIPRLSLFDNIPCPSTGLYGEFLQHSKDFAATASAFTPEHRSFSSLCSFDYAALLAIILSLVLCIVAICVGIFNHIQKMSLPFRASKLGRPEEGFKLAQHIFKSGAMWQSMSDEDEIEPSRGGELAGS